MSLRLAILCPGQGAQQAGMFDLARNDAAVARQIDGWGLPSLETMFANLSAQPLVVGAGCAMWEALRVRIPKPWLVTGYSVGEVTAMAVAGMLDAPDAIGLATHRARLMDACVNPALPQGLAAASGLSCDQLTPLLDPVDDRLRLHIAIENGIDQYIVGGTVAALEQLVARVASAGGKLQILPVSIASHTPWMGAAVLPLRAWLMQLPLRTPQLRLLSGSGADTIMSVSAAIAALTRKTVETVHWRACMDVMAELGITAALEIGPGAGLSRMLAARHPGIVCRSVADFRSLDGIVAWVDRLGN